MTKINISRQSSSYAITPDITLNCRRSITFVRKENTIPNLNLESTRPTIVLLEYMNAKGKHVKKIIDVYFERGFDVLQIKLKPLQLLFPVIGSQVVAKDLADFLMINKLLSPLVIHGFSVGGYVWGETLVHFQKNLQLYQSVVDRIKGHIFDSPADIQAIPTAFPSSVFPKNPIIRDLFSKYLRFHLEFCYESATKHYNEARRQFTNGLVKAPFLFITSNADDLSSPESVLKAKDEILEKNLEASVKIFDGSKHVMHFKSYTSEYISEVDAFLQKIGLLNLAHLKAKL